MRKLVRHSFTLATLLLPLALGQTPATKLTLAECIRLAESVPSAVSIARQEARIAALGVNIARTAFLPQSSFTGGTIYNSPTANGSRFVALNGQHEYISTANVGLEIDTSGRLRAAYARAKIDRDIAEAGSRISTRDLRRAVTISYYSLLAARKLSEAAETSFNEARSFETKTRSLFGGGEVAQADVVKASAQAVSFDQLRKAALLDSRLANQELASFWTEDVDKVLDVEDTLTEAPPSDEATARAYLRRPEFLILDLQKQGFQLDAKREHAALLPQVNFNYQYGIDANVYSYKERGSAVFATVNIPIFDWFKARSHTQQFTLKADQVSNVRSLTERAFSREYENAKARATSLFEQSKLAETQIKLYEDNLRLSQLRYQGGEGPALDVVVAQTQLQQARANYYTTLFQYANARAALEVARGQ